MVNNIGILPKTPFHKLSEHRANFLFLKRQRAPAVSKDKSVSKQITSPHESPHNIFVEKSSKMHWGFHGCKWKNNKECVKKKGTSAHSVTLADKISHPA